MNYEVLNQIRTTDSAEVFKDELELLLKSLYLGSSDFASVLKTKVRFNIASHIQKSISQEDVDIEKYLKGLIERIKKIPIVKLLVAYEPSEGVLEQYYSFIVDACQEYVLLDIGYSPEIIGGAIIEYKGRYKDFSFKTIFEEEFQLERKDILKMLER